MKKRDTIRFQTIIDSSEFFTSRREKKEFKYCTNNGELAGKLLNFVSSGAHLVYLHRYRPFLAGTKRHRNRFSLEVFLKGVIRCIYILGKRYVVLKNVCSFP